MLLIEIEKGYVKNPPTPMVRSNLIETFHLLLNDVNGLSLLEKYFAQTFAQLKKTLYFCFCYYGGKRNQY